MSGRLSGVLPMLVACALAAQGGIRVSFPAERQRLPAVTNTYVIGAVDAGRTELLYVNGVTTDVYRTGAFIAMVPVTPGTNTLTLFRGRERLVRTFVVAAAPAVPGKAASPIVADDDPRLGEPGTWKTTGSLFANRVRSEPDGSDSLFFLPRGFALRGAEVKDSPWLAVWLENRRGYLPRKSMARMPSLKLPPKGLMAPDILSGFSERPPYGKRPEEVLIGVDAGHGGSDSGALSPHGWQEKEVNLQQALAIRDALRKAGFQVFMTREDDSFPDLMSRPLRAYDERADAFISVHHNATAPGRDPRRVRHSTTYASMSNGLALARCIQKHVAKVVAPVPDAGAQMKSLAVCRNPAVPSCLLEVDFINLPEGEEASWDGTRQKSVAAAVVCGVLDWMTPPAAPPLPASEAVR
ncbi:MAG: N-acetylmuramoyl-L-alanine amidase [Kiritimatiellia bacterium]